MINHNFKFKKIIKMKKLVLISSIAFLLASCNNQPAQETVATQVTDTLKSIVPDSMTAAIADSTKMNHEAEEKNEKEDKD
jgi:hypothetical protein